MDWIGTNSNMMMGKKSFKEFDYFEEVLMD